MENEKRLTGKGVSYCASCDGGFFKGKPVVVVGGGNTAVMDVNYLSRLASKVYLINRSETFKAGQFAIEKLKKLKNVEIITNANVVKLNGKDVLTSIIVNKKGKNKTIDVAGIFFAIGSTPNLDFVKFDLKLDKYGYIVVDAKMQTSEQNVFACGDIIGKNFRQIVTACAEGATAGNSCCGG